MLDGDLLRSKSVIMGLVIVLAVFLGFVCVAITSTKESPVYSRYVFTPKNTEIVRHFISPAFWYYVLRQNGNVDVDLPLRFRELNSYVVVRRALYDQRYKEYLPAVPPSAMDSMFYCAHISELGDEELNDPVLKASLKHLVPPCDLHAFSSMDDLGRAYCLCSADLYLRLGELDLKQAELNTVTGAFKFDEYPSIFALDMIYRVDGVNISRLCEQIRSERYGTYCGALRAASALITICGESRPVLVVGFPKEIPDTSISPGVLERECQYIIDTYFVVRNVGG